MSNVLVVVEAFAGDFKKTALEAVSYGKEVAQLNHSTCSVLVLGASAKAGTLGIYGADQVLQISTQLHVGENQTCAKIIADQLVSLGATIVILVHNSTSKGIAGRLAIRLQGGCVSGVTGLPSIQGDDFIVERSVFAGKAKSKLSILTPYKVLSLAASAAPIKSQGVEVPVQDLTIGITNVRVNVLETKRVSGHIPLPEAELVVSAGRGMKDPSNWAIIEDLAAALGATTACSRPVADSGWRPHHEHVGQTGIAIKPKLYIAIGISGAIQHLAGVNNSKVIVVINKDPEAPFFKAADYGVCGDLFDIVPRLTAAIKKVKSSHT